MPIVGSSSQIFSPTQVGTDVILTGNIKDGEIKDADISASAAITMSKVNLAVTNAEVAAGAAIADTKLATISTAGKVNAAALTSLSSIPAGAGVIPVANLPSTVGYANGITTKNTGDASTTQNIAHGLGKAPKRCWIKAMYAGTSTSSAGAYNFAETIYNGTTQSSNSIQLATSSFSQVTTFTIGVVQAGYYKQTGVVTFDATNVIITWTQTDNATQPITYNILWEAEA